MNASPLHSTLREMRTLAGDPRSWTLLAGLSLVVGLVGPFGTFGLPFPMRLAYWAVVVVATATVGTLVAGLLEKAIGDRWPLLLRASVAGAIAGIPIALVVVLFNVVVFGPWFAMNEVLTLSVYCMLISAAVTVVSAVLERPQAVPPTAPSGAPALLDRVPLPQRGRLLHLAVTDHYVEVTTDKGRTLVLMRLSDAIRETAPVSGLQVHRSHWVALDAVSRAFRQAGKPMLELQTGTVIPISRTYLDAARAAGLAP